jgi:cytochrome c oxidase subunit II
MGWMTQASTSAQKADSVFLYVFALSVLFLVGITGVMICFVIRYSKKRHPKAEQIEGNTLLEIVWTAVPLILFLTIFYYGWTNYSYMSNAPRDSMVVKVLGRQWNWSFVYPNGKQTTLLYAALGKPMKLEIRSADVIHGFYVPAFRLKMDAVPGRVNTTWFEPTQLGAYDIECTVICGVSHSLMLSKVVIVPEDEFKAWYFGGDDAPEPGARAFAEAKASESGGGGNSEPPGLMVLRAKNCLSCHSTDGKPMVGPTFKGLFGSEVTLVEDGKERTAKVDEAHVERAIQDPMAERVKGYPPTMPPNPLTPKELLEVMDYLKSLKDTGSQA